MEAFMFLSKKNMKDVKKYRYILMLLLVHNSSSAMFRGVGQATTLPATRMARVQPSSVSNPRISMQYPSWRSTARRWFSSLKEMLSKKPEEIEQYKKQIAEAKKPLPPTAAHLLHWLLGKRDWRVQETPKQFLELRGFTNIDPDQVDAIMAAEKKFFEMGFHILYHSTQASYYALHYIDTQLALLYKRLIEGESVPKNIPLRLRQKTGSKHIENKNLQQRFINKGAKNDLRDRQFLLSCNPALTSNFSNPGECTLRYWDEKENIHGLPISHLEEKLNEILEQYHDHDIVPYIDVFKDRIDDSVRRLDASLKTGVLLQLVFKDPILAQKSIYVSEPFGKKRLVKMADSTTENILDIMKAFSSPELSLYDINGIQYRVVLTDTLLLDVFNKNIYENFEIHAYANPQEALETFHQEIRIIMEQIERAFNDTNAARGIEAELKRQLINFRFYPTLSKGEELRKFTSAEIEQALEKYQGLETKLKKVQDRNFEKFGLKPFEYSPEEDLLIPIKGNVSNKILADRAERDLKEELLSNSWLPKFINSWLPNQRRLEKILKDFQEFKRKQFAPSAMEHRPEPVESKESEL
jgi:hypothetical protein